VTAQSGATIAVSPADNSGINNDFVPLRPAVAAAASHDQVTAASAALRGSQQLSEEQITKIFDIEGGWGNLQNVPAGWPVERFGPSYTNVCFWNVGASAHSGSFVLDQCSGSDFVIDSMYPFELKQWFIKSSVGGYIHIHAELDGQVVYDGDELTNTSYDQWDFTSFFVDRLVITAGTNWLYIDDVTVGNLRKL
jgi:hypothetical protein